MMADDGTSREIGELKVLADSLCERLDEFRQEAKERFREGTARFERLETLIKALGDCGRAEHETLRLRISALESWRNGLLWLVGFVIAGAGMFMAWLNGAK